MNKPTSKILAAAVAGALAMAASGAHATLALTQAGISAGFTLSNIVSGLPGATSGYDVLGSAINSQGQIVMYVSAAGANYVFNDVDGQTAANALSQKPFSGFPPAFAVANGSVWASGGVLHRLNSDGSTAQTYGNITANYGMWTNPVTQQLITIGGGGIYKIDVSGATPVETLITSQAGGDGLTVAPDGLHAYTSSGQVIDLTTGTVTSAFSVTGADGMGIISSTNKLNGAIIVNTTVGNIVMVDPVTFQQTIVASGGGYGDFAGADPTNGTLMVGSSNSLWRLGCGQGCGVGSAPPPADPGNGNPVPEPDTIALMGLAGAAMAFVRRRANRS